MINDVTKQGVRIHARKVRILTICIVTDFTCLSYYIERMKLTEENILKIALALLIGIFIGYLIAEYLLPIVRQ